MEFKPLDSKCFFQRFVKDAGGYPIVQFSKSFSPKRGPCSFAVASRTKIYDNVVGQPEAKESRAFYGKLHFHCRHVASNTRGEESLEPLPCEHQQTQPSTRYESSAPSSNTTSYDHIAVDSAGASALKCRFGGTKVFPLEWPSPLPP